MLNHRKLNYALNICNGAVIEHVMDISLINMVIFQITNDGKILTLSNSGVEIHT